MPAVGQAGLSGQIVMPGNYMGPAGIVGRPGIPGRPGPPPILGPVTLPILLNLTTMCYISSEASKYYMQVTEGSRNHLAMDSAPRWSMLSKRDWARYRFRFLMYDEPGKYTLVAMQNDHEGHYINELGPEPRVAALSDGPTFIWLTPGAQLISLQSRKTRDRLCSNGTVVLMKADRCQFNCYPRVTFQGSQFSTVQTGKTYVTVDKRGKPGLESKEFIKAKQRRERAKQGRPGRPGVLIGPIDVGESFTMCRYEYDMGNEKLKAVLIRNTLHNTYLQCRLNKYGRVSGIGTVRASRTCCPAEIDPSDHRLFILGDGSNMKSSLQCHQDPALSVVPTSNGLELSSTLAPPFEFKPSGASREKSGPSGSKPEDKPCNVEQRLKCGKGTYHPFTQICCAGTINPRTAGRNGCCGKRSLNSHTHICCSGIVRQNTNKKTRCCERGSYDSDRNICCGHRIHRKVYGQTCCRDGQVRRTGCCDDRFWRQERRDARWRGCQSWLVGERGEPGRPGERRVSGAQA